MLMTMMMTLFAASAAIGMWGDGDGKQPEYPQGEDGACVERDEVLDINTEKSKNKQNRGCFGCISETAFFVRMPQGLCRKSVVFRQ